MLTPSGEERRTQGAGGEGTRMRIRPFYIEGNNNRDPNWRSGAGGPEQEAAQNQKLIETDVVRART